MRRVGSDGLLQGTMHDRLRPARSVRPKMIVSREEFAQVVRVDKGCLEHPLILPATIRAIQIQRTLGCTRRGGTGRERSLANTCARTDANCGTATAFRGGAFGSGQFQWTVMTQPLHLFRTNPSWHIWPLLQCVVGSATIQIFLIGVEVVQGLLQVELQSPDRTT